MDRKLIYSTIANEINTYDANVYVTQKYEPIPKSIPCVFVEMVSKVRSRQYANLCNTDDQYRYTFEVQVFHTSLTAAYELMEFIEEKFKAISFFEDMCQPIDNADQSVTRIVARFSAQLGAKA